MFGARARAGLSMAGLVAMAATAAACSSAAPRTIDATSAARQISAQLASRYKLAPPPVSCPSGVQARPGRTFICTTTVEGQPLRMNATVTTASGRFSVQPAEPLLVATTVAAQLATEITRRAGRTATVTCPPPSVIVAPVGHTFDCSAVFAGQAARKVTVTVVDGRGDFSFQLAPAP